MRTARVRHDRRVTEKAGAYFSLSTDGLKPVPAARSPWSADMLHGRLLAGLAARAVEDADHHPELRIGVSPSTCSARRRCRHCR